jgi:hypothetical protein
MEIGHLAELALKLGTPGAVDLIRAIETAGAQLARRVSEDLGVASGACRCTDGQFIILFRESIPGQLIPPALAHASPESPWELDTQRHEVAPASPVIETFHRTVYEIEVLSRDAVSASSIETLADIARSPDVSAELRPIGPERLTPLDFAVAIREHGADPRDFGVDDCGGSLS